MVRKNPNSVPGVWLGLLLVLVAHTLAKSKTDDYNDYDGMVLGKALLPPEQQNTDVNVMSSIQNDKSKSIKNEAKDFITKKRTDGQNVVGKLAASSESTLIDPLLSDISGKSNYDEIKTTPKTTLDHLTLQDNKTIPTIATIDLAKHLATNDSASIVEEIKAERGIESADVQTGRTDDTIIDAGQSEKVRENEEKPLTTSQQEFEFTGEQENFEEHTSSAFAEATTPSSNLFSVARENIQQNSYKNVERFDTDPSDDRNAGRRNTTSLLNDINVNYNGYLKNGSRKFQKNNTSISNSNNGTSSEHDPNHQVDIFNTVALPSMLRISETTDNDTAIDNTTPYDSSFKPKGRTISTTGDNDLSTKKPKNFNYTSVNQTTSDMIMKIIPKKSMSTEKPTDSTPPYPYLKAETNFTNLELVTEITKKSEQSTEEISAYENIIGRNKSDQQIVVTEPSVLVENSIQQFKPIHYKRSGISSRLNSTLDIPVASSAWSLATTEDLAAKNETGVTEESRTTISDNVSRSQINNDVPQDKPNKNVTTETSTVILFEVTENSIKTVEKIDGTDNLTTSTPESKKMTEHSEITVENIAQNASTSAESQVSNTTEKVDTVSKSSSTSNEIQIENGDSKTTPNKLNGTEGSTEYPLSRDNFSISTGAHASSTLNATEKASPEIETAVPLPITISTTTEANLESSGRMPTSQSLETRLIEENVANVTGLEKISESHGSTKSITEPTTIQTTTVEYEFIELTTAGINSTVSEVDITSSEKPSTYFPVTTFFLNETSKITEPQETMVTDGFTEQNETAVSGKIETFDPEIPASSTTLSFDTTTTSNINSEVTPNEDLSNGTNFPVSEISFTPETDVYTDTTLSSTSFNDDTPRGRIDVTTTGQNYDLEETSRAMITEAVAPIIEEATTISNIEVIVSSETTDTPQTSTTITQTTTLPEFPVFNDDVTLFIKVVIEGSLSDVCPLLNDLRVLLANILTEGTKSIVLPRNIILHQTQCSLETTPSTTLTPILVYVVDDKGRFDYTMTDILPSLYKTSSTVFPLPIRSVEKVPDTESNNNAIAVVAVSSVAFICLVLLAGLLFIMRKRQTRFNYGERCRPVSLDAFRVDSVSAYNSVRRKGLTRASKRSYGNPAFEDSSVTPTHPLNFAGLSSFCNESNAITEEFEGIPQVTARMDELPAGSEVKNRYANVAPLPETRVLLQKINNEPLTEYINASYVRGPKNATKYYIACQAPMESTVSDFWRMIWEQQSKVIIMLTDIVENGVEKCVEYIPPSEVTDCHRLYGDYQVTLKKREAKEKYAISTLHLKNLENNTYREVSHIWYLWPTNGVPSNGTGLIAILLEARALQRGAPGPIVVHCSPGTGRTGTLIALDLGIRQYEITRTVDVPRVVYTIRRDRAGAVQTKEQYVFIYKALNLYAAKLAGGALESM